MEREERLKVMLRGNLNTDYVPRHCQLACQVLDALKKTLEANRIYVKDDLNWPYHIGVRATDGKLISLFCGGFRKTIEIQKLRKDGTADTRYKEVSFMTPQGAANYVLKLQDKWRNR